jgi:hypothetical protein
MPGERYTVGLTSPLEVDLADLDMARTAVRGRDDGGASRWHCTNPDRWVVWWGEWPLRATSYRVPPALTTLYTLRPFSLKINLTRFATKCSNQEVCVPYVTICPKVVVF